ncbi:hypothetical protein GJ744_005985 [Endocarpon pusillum]|uniref:Uncharacterized protein n=1 Tax=Endocarpon pusillum TaxID=364733 RepID=A0A8H7A6P5_9EURO|nr:hypothetical protein GJ744_005985 [Endocarpon pusillum]
MRTSAESCSICKLLLQAFQQYCDGGQENINIEETSSALRVTASGQRLLRFCAESKDAPRRPRRTPIGRPVLPDSDNRARFALLRKWLHRCDKSHNCNKRKDESMTALPTRVLYVGDRYPPDYVRWSIPQKKAV